MKKIMHLNNNKYYLYFSRIFGVLYIFLFKYYSIFFCLFSCFAFLFILMLYSSYGIKKRIFSLLLVSVKCFFLCFQILNQRVCNLGPSLEIKIEDVQVQSESHQTGFIKPLSADRQIDRKI